MSFDELLNGKKCSNPDCDERVMVRGDNEQNYIKIEHHVIDGTFDSLYYHEDCAPLGATRIPDKLNL